jgi:uncharacterized membrane protein
MPPETLALLAAVSFALFAVYGWLGLRSSTPLTATVVSLAARTLTLAFGVALEGGVPQYHPAAMQIFVFLGVLQSAISLLTFLGIQKVGTSRSQALRNSYPLWSAVVAVGVMGEQAGFAVLMGTMLVVAGVVAISWKPESAPPSYRTWHVLYSLAGGFLAGVAFPLRRHGLTITDEPMFFSFVIAIVSLVGAIPFALWSGAGRGLVWHRRAVVYFALSGFFEAMGAWLTLLALAAARVVVVSPIVATTPLFSLFLSLIFLRGKERVTGLSIAGTAAVVTGTIAIALGR